MGRCKSSPTALLMKKSPRDYKALLWIVFFESSSSFIYSGVFLFWLEDELKTGDAIPRYFNGLSAGAVAIFSLLFGWVVDKLLVRATLLLHIGSITLCFAALAILSSEMIIGGVLIGPLALSMALGGSVVQIGIRRVVKEKHHKVAYAIQYSVQQFGAIVAMAVPDVARLYLVPFVNEATGHDWGYRTILAGVAALHAIAFCIAFLFVRDVQVVTKRPTPAPDNEIALSDLSDQAVAYESEDSPVLYATDTEEGEPLADGSAVNLRVATVDEDDCKWAVEPLHRGGCKRKRNVPRLDEDDFEFLTDELDSAPASTPEDTPSPWTWYYLWRYMALSISAAFVNGLFLSLRLVYPDFLRRAEYAAVDAEAVPYMSLLLLNPIIVICLSVPIGNLVKVKDWHVYNVVTVGTIVSAVSPLFMATVSYWGAVVFVLLLSLGESIWSSQLNTLANFYAPKGTEGMFFSVSRLPLFPIGLAMNGLSVVLLSRYCPAANQCSNGGIIWLFITAMAMLTPTLLLVFRPLLKITPRHPDVRAKEAAPSGLRDTPRVAANEFGTDVDDEAEDFQ